MNITVQSEIKLIEMGYESPNLLSLKRQNEIIKELNYDTCKAVIILGNNKIFSAGLNLNHLLNADSAGVSEIFENFGKLLASIRNFPGPVFSIISGHAIAGGCLLALSCDYRYGVFGFHKMGLTELALSLDLPKEFFLIISSTVNPNALFEISTQCRLYSPKQAFKKGLINEYIGNPFVGKKIATNFALKKAKKLAKFYIDAGSPFCRLKQTLVNGANFDHKVLVQNWFSVKTQKKINRALINLKK